MFPLYYAHEINFFIRTNIFSTISVPQTTQIVTFWEFSNGKTAAVTFSEAWNSTQDAWMTAKMEKWSNKNVSYFSPSRSQKATDSLWQMVTTCAVFLWQNHWFHTSTKMFWIFVIELPAGHRNIWKLDWILSASVWKPKSNVRLFNMNENATYNFKYLH